MGPLFSRTLYRYAGRVRAMTTWANTDPGSAQDARSPDPFTVAGPSGTSNRPVAQAKEAELSEDESSTGANQGSSSSISNISFDSDQGIDMSPTETGDTSDEASTIRDGEGSFEKRWEAEMIENNLHEGLPMVDPSTVAGPSGVGPSVAHKAFEAKESSAEDDEVFFKPPVPSKKGIGSDAAVETTTMHSESAENPFNYAAHGKAAAVETTPAAVQSELAVNKMTEYAGSSEPLSGFNSGGSDWSTPSPETERTVRETMGKKAFSFKIFPTDGSFLQSTTIFLFFFLQRNNTKMKPLRPYPPRQSCCTIKK